MQSPDPPTSPKKLGSPSASIIHIWGVDQHGCRRVEFSDGRVLRTAFGLKNSEHYTTIHGVAVVYADGGTVYFERHRSVSSRNILTAEVSGRFPAGADAAADAIVILQTGRMIELEHERISPSSDLQVMQESAIQLSYLIAAEYWQG